LSTRVAGLAQARERDALQRGATKGRDRQRANQQPATRPCR
jgi:hypothetical protein